MTFASEVHGNLKVPIIAADEDSGPLVRALVDSTPGKNLIGYREWATFEELAKAFSEATGLPARYRKLEIGEVDLPLPAELKQELADNWAYFNEFGYEGRDDPTVIHPSQVCSSHLFSHMGVALTL